MIKKISLTFIFVSVCCFAFAQTDSTNRKKINHYIGIQANPLFRQIINLSNNAAVVTNPYQLTYDFMFRKCGWGIQTGLGYTYQVTGDKNSAANHQSVINDVFYRAGFGKKKMIAKKFEATFGFDIAGDYRNDNTYALSVTGFSGGSSDSVETRTASSITSIGGGLRGGLSFYISRRVILSTEANYYFFNSVQKQNTFLLETITQPGFPTTTNSSNENSDTRNKKFALTLPAVLFLVVKF